MELLDREERLLQVPWEDTGWDKEAAVLGAPLTAGKDLYTDLQCTYAVPAVKTWHL